MIDNKRIADARTRAGRVFQATHQLAQDVEAMAQTIYDLQRARRELEGDIRYLLRLVDRGEERARLIPAIHALLNHLPKEEAR